MGGIPYGLILLVAVGMLTARHAKADHASLRSKCVVSGFVVASVLISPAWPLAVAVAQLSVCVYVIFYRIVADELTKSDSGCGVRSAERISRPTDPGNNEKSGPS